MIDPECPPGQLDLLEPPANTCGQCVHRNARRTDDLGACTPLGGYQRRDAPACSQFFPHDQLIASLAKRPGSAHDDD